MKKITFLLVFVAISISISYGSFFNLTKDQPEEIITENQISKSDKKCIDCHSKLVEGKKLHAPVDDCTNCHTGNTENHPNNTDKIKLTEKTPDLCYICHDPLNTQKYKHVPVEEGECSICHSVHSSNNNSLLIQERTSSLCMDCHDIGSVADKKIKHAPIEDGDCSICHDPHQSDNRKILKTKTPELCFECHSTEQEELSKKNVHAPFSDECNSCHDVHESSENFLLIEKSPNLCYMCHESVSNKKNIHGPVKEGDCTTCHSAHASSERGMLKKDAKTLCLNCHSKEIKTDVKTIANIGHKLKSSKFVHGVIEVDGCSACHNPHASDNEALLTKSFPMNEYAEADFNNFALCFECHDRKLIEQETNPLITEFRQGEKNLHFFHINGKKGRNCSTCHDIHASNNKHLIAESVRFGNWDMPMDYKADINGGTCATGCHSKRIYVNNTY